MVSEVRGHTNPTQDGNGFLLLKMRLVLVLMVVKGTEYRYRHLGVQNKVLVLLRGSCFLHQQVGFHATVLALKYPPPSAELSSSSVWPNIFYLFQPPSEDDILWICSSRPYRLSGLSRHILRRKSHRHPRFS